MATVLSINRSEKLHYWPTPPFRAAGTMPLMAHTPALHRYLAAWRANKGLSQEQVANILGVDKSTVHRWEQGKRTVDLADLERLAAIYEVDPVALLMAPEDVALAARLTKAKAVLQAISPDAADRWLGTGADIAGTKLP